MTHKTDAFTYSALFWSQKNNNIDLHVALFLKLKTLNKCDPNQVTIELYTGLVHGLPVRETLILIAKINDPACVQIVEVVSL